MCMRWQDRLCTLGNAQRQLEGWQSRSAGWEAERDSRLGPGSGVASRLCQERESRRARK